MPVQPVSYTHLDVYKRQELAGVTEPEGKRKIIGKGFIDVFDVEAHKIKDVKWLSLIHI